MSLRVWLPLTGHLDNQGLSDYSISMFRGTETYNANGKLGKCFYANGVNTIKILNIIPDFYNYTAYSISAWFYIEARNTSHSGSAIISAGNWNSQVINLAVSDWSSDHYTLLRISGTSWGKTYSYNFNLNTWYHVVVSCDGSKTYAYVNGVLIGDTQPSFLPSSIEGNDIAIGGATYYAGMQFFGRINDVRIYDHCLSQKEIKEISKGLVAHYTLGDSYLEGTTNLCTTPDCLSATCYNGATGKYGYGTNTDIYKTTGIFNGKFCTKVYMGTSGNSARPYPYVSNMFVSNGTNQPKNKTISFDYYGTIGTYINPYKLGNGSATCDWRNNATTTKSGTFTNSGAIPVVPNTWNHISFTLTGTTDANAEWGYIILGDTHTSDTSNYWLFANFQIEAKDHETGYAGVGGTRNESIVYDCSGYNYHGTTGGTLTVDSTTPRYSVSTKFAASSGSFSHPNITLSQFTFSFWAKHTVANRMLMGSNASLTSSNANWYWYGDNSFKYAGGEYYYQHNAGSAESLLGTWIHFVATYDGANITVYRNGVNEGSKAVTGDKTLEYLSIGNGYTSGYWAGGWVSDFRLYSTCLSEEDIRALYNTPVSISNTGAMFTQGEFVER